METYQIKQKVVALGMIVTALPLAIHASTSVQTEKQDTVSIKEENKSDRGVLLNASNATEPRQVQIGLPMSYTAVNLNGLPAVYYYWPNTTSNHWRNELLLKKTGLMPISNVAILYGDIGYGVDSYAETGSDEFHGKLKYMGNTYGNQNFDINLSGALSKNWRYVASVYQNFDPGSFDMKFTNFADRAQFYTAGLTHLSNSGKSKFSLFYKYTNVRPLTTAANYAPFIYKGDGEVAELDNFKMGRDSYLPVDGMMTYRDVRTGKLENRSLYDIVKTKTHDVSAFWDLTLENNSSLSLRGRVSTSKGGGTDQLTMGIVTDADAEYADGSGAFHGNIQRRLAQLNFSTTTDALFTGEWKKKTNNHSWTAGLNEWYSYINYARSTTQYYHEVAPNPRKLIYEGQEYANLNGSTEYDKGFENKLAAYVSDSWNILKNLKVTYGLRLEYYHLNVDYISNPRFTDFYIGATYTNADGRQQTVATTNHSKNALNYAISLAPTCHITNNFGLTGEINYLKQYRHLEAYSGATLPYFSYRPFTLGRVGIFFDNPYINLVSAFTYAKRTNDYSRLTVMSDNPNEDPAMIGASSGIQTIGWTTDAMIYPFKGFQLHFMFTYQSPKYTGYTFDAFNKHYDFSNKIVTKQSKILVEIDPNYTIGNFNIWASFRYFSKQYANVGNSVYFKGRWETFGGVNYKVNKYLQLSANVINFLNQTGAQGTIPGSELITDGSRYAGTLMAGNYIRPFTVEFSARINF